MSEQTNPLAACPFCGGNPAFVPRAVNLVLQKDPSDPKFGVSVICGRCGAESSNMVDEAHAAARWNRRAGTSSADAPASNAASALSEFIRNATDGEKAALYMKVMDAAGEIQRAVIAAGTSLPASPRSDEKDVGVGSPAGDGAPVAWALDDGEEIRVTVVDPQTAEGAYDGYKIIPLYTSPPVRDAEETMRLVDAYVSASLRWDQSDSMEGPNTDTMHAARASLMAHLKGTP